MAQHDLPRLADSSGELELFDRLIHDSSEKIDEYRSAWHLLTEEDAEGKHLMALLRPGLHTDTEAAERHSLGRPLFQSDDAEPIQSSPERQGQKAGTGFSDRL